MKITVGLTQLEAPTETRGLSRGDLIERVRQLNLATLHGRENAAVVEITAYTTTLAMNYLTRGKFTAE